MGYWGKNVSACVLPSFFVGLKMVPQILVFFWDRTLELAHLARYRACGGKVCVVYSKSVQKNFFFSMEWSCHVFVCFFVQIVFGPAYSCVDFSGFFVTVKQEDFVFAACHEGINRSQVSLFTPKCGGKISWPAFCHRVY